jgi:type I restriction enzyme S subunit
MKVDRDILNNLCLNITDGEHGTIQNDNNGRYFLLSNKNIINGQIIISDADRRINKESFSKINKRTKLENGDLVISTVGVLGKLAIIKTENLNYDFQRSVGIVKCDEKKINTKYLYYYLNTQFVQNRLNHLSKGAVQKCLFISDLKNLEIDFPDLPTQQKIASVLSALDDKIELNNRINAELEAMAKTLYDYWFVQFDFPIVTSSGVEKPYKASGGKMVYNETLKREIPEGWEVKSVGEFAKIKKGTLITEKTANTNGNVKVVSAGLYFSYFHSESNFPNNTISISASSANAGYINFWREPIFACDCTTVRGNNDFETFYILQFLKSVQEFIYSQARGSAQPHVYPKDIEALNIIVPNKKNLHRYGEIVYSMNEKITNNLKQNQELSSLRDWLLPMLMNGQVKVG